MLLPDHAVDALLQEKRPEHRTYEHTFAYPNTLGQNTSVENKPCLESEWDGDQHRDTVNNDPADQMVRWNSGTEDVKLSPVRSSRPRPVEDVNPNTGISGNDSSEVVNSNSAISLVPENTNIQTTKRKGKELFLAPGKVRERAQTHMDTPSGSNLNPFFDNPNYKWKGEADTPALIQYIEKKFDSLTRKSQSNQNLDKSGMNIGNSLTPGGNQPQFVHESSNPKDGGTVDHSHPSGETPQTPSTTPQKRQHNVQISVTNRFRGRHSLPSPHKIPKSLSSQLPNATPTATAAMQDGPDLVDTLFSATEFKGKHGSVCTYKCPHSGEMCRLFLSGRDRRNRYRHLATHAQTEEEFVVSGVIAMEDALAFTRLPKTVVKCGVEGCQYETKVWRTDQVRERHEMEVHPEEYTQRVRKRKNAKRGGRQ